MIIAIQLSIRERIDESIIIEKKISRNASALKMNLKIMETNREKEDV